MPKIVTIDKLEREIEKRPPQDQLKRTSHME